MRTIPWVLDRGSNLSVKGEVGRLLVLFPREIDLVCCVGEFILQVKRGVGDRVSNFLLLYLGLTF